MRQDAVSDAQPAHVGSLRRRDIKQPVIAPAEIVGRLRRIVVARLLLQACVGIERMLLALDFFGADSLPPAAMVRSCALM